MSPTLSKLDDVDAILHVYDLGIEFQKSLFYRHWPGFDRDLLIREINESRHWKIVRDGEIACVFSVQFEDALVWKDSNEVPAIYLHRIMTHPKFRGNAYVKTIISWGKEYARENGKRYLRLDTFQDNTRLVAYYLQCGFTFCGLRYFTPDEGAPEHYREGLGLFEMPVEIRAIY